MENEKKIGFLTLSANGKKVVCCDKEAAGEIVIPEGVAEIGFWAFKRCLSLRSVIILDGVTKIGAQAFWNCKSLKSIHIPDGVTQLDGTFEECKSLSAIHIPESVVKIGSFTFAHCSSLKAIALPNNITEIEEYTFCDCVSLVSITIPGSVTRIGCSAFNDCQTLKSIDIPDGVTEIGKYAFYNCEALTSICIPDSVVKIGSSAFEGCKNLTDVYVCENTRFGKDVFKDSPNVVLHRRPLSIYAVFATVKDADCGDLDTNDTSNTFFTDKKSAIAAAKILYFKLLSEFGLEDNSAMNNKEDDPIPGGFFAEYDYAYGCGGAEAFIYDTFESENGRVSQRAAITVVPLHPSESPVEHE